MHQVEELCDRILLINNGRDLLYGNLAGIRRQFAGQAVLVRADGPLPPLDGVTEVSSHNGTSKLTLAGDTDPQNVLRQLVDRQLKLEQFEIALPTLDEIFIRVVRAGEPLQ
jgi:ABC-2 type transport system ATP-binding protein